MQPGLKTSGLSAIGGTLSIAGPQLPGYKLDEGRGDVLLAAASPRSTAVLGT